MIQVFLSSRSRDPSNVIEASESALEQPGFGGERSFEHRLRIELGAIIRSPDRLVFVIHLLLGDSVKFSLFVRQSVRFKDLIYPLHDALRTHCVVFLA